jgi:hypothetical protein
MSYETQNNKPNDSTAARDTEECPACGEDSEKCYRCTECGRDLVRDTVGGESQ